MKYKVTNAIFTAAIAFGGVTAAHAQEAFGLAPVFTDHAVLQRDKPVAVWGQGPANEAIRLTLSEGNRVVTSTSGKADASGRFSLTLPQQAAGGPYALTVSDTHGHTQTLNDILVGDVWLCSGQSNMEFPLKAANNGESEVAGAGNPQLRIFDVPRNSQASPVTGFVKGAQWKVSSPASVPNTSAVCYFMARELADKTHVPQGVIHASWGGTAAELWVSREGLSAFDDMREVLSVQDLYRTDPRAAMSDWEAHSKAWWREHDPDYNQVGLWSGKGFDDAVWPTLVASSVWESSGVPALRAFDGVVWYRQTVTLTADQAAHAVSLDLGPVDDSDTTWVNGVLVGTTDGWTLPRHYTLPKGTLKAGQNVIAVRVLDSGGGGGLYGAPSDRALLLESGARITLSAEWHYHIGADIKAMGTPPTAPWSEAAAPAVLYNGMIAPLGNLSMRGVAWYQGESNTGTSSTYQDLLTRFMADWRGKFGAQLPFLIVQLANYGQPPTAPVESGWAEVREAQRLAVANDAHAGLAVAIDIGERYDIHPANKQEVGRRLARAARRVVYSQQIAPSGPVALSARRTGTSVVVTFGDVADHLLAYGADEPIGFELCTRDPGSCRYAKASIEGERVYLDASAFVAATRVRYCWADSPICTLYDESGLPAGPFELPIPH